jgi:hypothetical protein
MILKHTYLTRSTYSNLLCSRQQGRAGPQLLRKRTPDTIHNTTADRSVGPYPVSLPIQPMKQWGQSQPPVDGRLVGLLGTYISMRSVRSILARGGQHIDP